MLSRYCPNCGTEVDDTAVFCPTCGQPIDEAMETEIPAAPAWPEPAAPRDEAVPPPPAPAVEAPTWAIPAVPPEAPAAPAAPEPAVEAAPASPVWSPEVEPARRAEPPPPLPGAGTRPGPSAPSRTSVQMTTPVTLSAWLIGVGAALGALGALIGLFGGFVNPVDFVMVLALVAIALSVFAAPSLPAFAHLRLATLAVAFVGFGMALDRIGFGRAGAGDLLFFLGTAAVGIGAILVELGQDQPVGGPRA